ncbi:MAG: DNA-3-methyladenine glycosylase I [Gallionella sp.]|nr:DNA-3-methyladenine glycosylase I [Gallionella sp.]
MTDAVCRCAWAGSDELYRHYHDREWGVPLHDDHKLFEFLILEGAQAGLSWITVLRKREHYRAAFDDFAVQRIARYTPAHIESLLQNPGIVRNRLKVNAAVLNAQKFLEVQAEFGSFDHYIWQFAGGQTRQNARRSMAEVPASTAESDAMSKELKRRGFKFVGTTICYAFMQATGMVNDHTTDCFRYAQLNKG